MNRLLHYLFGIVTSIILTPYEGLSATKTSRPNIIFIYAEDLGRGDVVDEVSLTRLAQSPM